MADRLTVSAQQPLSPLIVDQVRAKLAYTDERIARAEIAEDGVITLEFHGDLSDAEIESVHEKVDRVVATMVGGGVPAKLEILEDHLDRQVPYEADPMEPLLEQREVFIEERGVLTLGPLPTDLIQFFERGFLSLADEFGARPYRFPTLISAELLGRVDYYRSFPHSLTFATHLREDLDVIDSFSAQATYEEDGLNADPRSFSKVQALLSPAVCFHYYGMLQGDSLESGKVVTAVGNCFRYESSNLTSMERMWDFTMREIIFVGPKSFVVENRARAMEQMTEMLAEWGLAYRVESANDPFFVGEFRKQAAFQSAFKLKYEIRASIPFRAGTLAVGSYNHHQDFFGRKLEITAHDGNPAHTGCVAFGLERLAYAFLAQYGLDRDSWPQAVRDGAG